MCVGQGYLSVCSTGSRGYDAGANVLCIHDSILKQSEVPAGGSSKLSVKIKDVCLHVCKTGLQYDLSQFSVVVYEHLQTQNILRDPWSS